MAIRKTDPRGIHAQHDVRGEVQDFVDGLARSMIAGDGDAVATMFDLPALIIGDDGVLAPESTQQVAQFCIAAKAYYNAQGIVDTRADLIDLERIGKRIVIATVRWPHLDASGNEVASESFDYTLRRDVAGRFRIRTVLMRGQITQPKP